MTDVTTNEIPVDDRGKKQEQLRSFLEYPGESPQADYKSSEAFDGKSEFSLKLTRHILGMANAGGGYLIIGFPEGKDSKPQRDKNIGDEVISTYEATTLPQMVAKKIRGTNKLDLIVHHVDYKGKRYPVLEIGEFSETPFFCNSEHRDSNGKIILRQGALYIRTANSNTEEIANPEEWEKLIRISMRKRNEELLERFSKLLEQAQKGTSREQSTQKDPPRPPVWFDLQRKVAQSAMTENGFEKGFWEVTSYLSKSSRSWGHSQLLEAMSKSALRNTGWPQGIVLHTAEYKPQAVKDGVQETIAEKPRSNLFDHWGISKKGEYFFQRTFEEDEATHEDRDYDVLYFDTRIWRIAEAIDHTYSLYSQLEVDPQEEIILSITHKGIKGRHLTAHNWGRAFTFRNRVSSEDIATWEVKTNLDELKVNRKTYVSEAIRGISVFFDFFEPQQIAIDSIIEEFDNSRL